MTWSLDPDLIHGNKVQVLLVFRLTIGKTDGDRQELHE